MPPTGQEGSLFSTPSPVFTVYGLLDDGHSHWYEATSHYGFDWIFIIFIIELHELFVYFGYSLSFLNLLVYFGSDESSLLCGLFLVVVPWVSHCSDFSCCGT